MLDEDQTHLERIFSKSSGGQEEALETKSVVPRQLHLQGYQVRMTRKGAE